MISSNNIDNIKCKSNNKRLIDWSQKRIKDIKSIKLIMGQSPPSSTYNKEKMGLPFFQGKNEFGYMYPLPKIYCNRPKVIAKQYDILLSVRAPVGDVNIAPFECCIGRGLAALRVIDNNIDYLYLFYFLQFNKNKFNNISMGSTFKAIRKQEIENLKIPLPSIVEQKKIAEILYTIDESIQKSDLLISKIKKLKKGLMQKLFTEGLDHKEFKNTPMGKIPKDWFIDKLENVVNIYDNKRIPLSKMERSTRKGLYPYCGANGIIDYIDDYIFNGEYILVAEDGGAYNSFSKTAYLMKGKFWVNNHAHVIKAKEDKMINKFLMYLLNFLDLTPYIVGSTRVKLNLSYMKKIHIVIPKINEQQKIAEILFTLDQKLDFELKRKEKLIRLKKGLMHHLFTGKKRVNIG